MGQIQNCYKVGAKIAKLGLATRLALVDDIYIDR
jgi:hypothetical protein